MASSRPRIEEVADEDDIDIDNMDFDPADYDPRAPIIRPADIPSTASSAAALRRPPPQQQQPLPSQPELGLSAGFNQTKYINKSDMEGKFRKYQCVYPLYFDAAKSKAEGRRVGKKNAIPNPLAREIVAALNSQGFQTIFEPTKSHPKDWANPGRVRVLLKEDGEPVHPTIKTKRQMFDVVAQWLQDHPTLPESPLLLRFHGMPHPDKPPPPPAVPKGWKINEILPLHSPALSGGGVSDNIFKEMMGEMAGAGGDRSATPPPKEKKDKKKKK
ncbi:signal recognition particle subunit [Arthrobotrys musiformis]|uniref:Signal recognition particle subunit n=1 Tax=Arthrobotrys musiformis TaxID=47236 RepID=A0AAV9VXM5_9PEZI